MTDLREFLGLSQQDLANYLGIDRSFISQIERGKRVLSDKLARLMHPFYQFYGNHTSIQAPDPWKPQEVEQIHWIIHDLQGRKLRLMEEINLQKSVLQKKVTALKGMRNQQVFCEEIRHLDYNALMWANDMHSIRKTKAKTVNERKLFQVAMELMLNLNALEKTEAMLTAMQDQKASPSQKQGLLHRK